MPTRNARQTLEWLATGRPEFWHASGELNIYKLSKALSPRVSQSTLDRLYRGVSKSFSEQTIEALADFFDVTKASIRGEDGENIHDYSHDITIAEFRLICQIRRLNPERKRLVLDQIRLMLPEEKAGNPRQETEARSHH